MNEIIRLEKTRFAVYTFLLAAFMLSAIVFMWLKIFGYIDETSWWYFVGFVLLGLGFMPTRG